MRLFLTMATSVFLFFLFLSYEPLLRSSRTDLNFRRAVTGEHEVTTGKGSNSTEQILKVRSEDRHPYLALISNSMLCLHSRDLREKTTTKTLGRSCCCAAAAP